MTQNSTFLLLSIMWKEYIGSEVLTPVVMKSSIFWDITPGSPLKVCLPPAFTPVSCLTYSLNLKLEEKCSSETSVDFQRAAPRCISKDRTLHVGNKLFFFTKWGTLTKK
jgi:hypothetical protein